MHSEYHNEKYTLIHCDDLLNLVTLNTTANTTSIYYYCLQPIYTVFIFIVSMNIITLFLSNHENSSFLSSDTTGDGSTSLGIFSMVFHQRHPLTLSEDYKVLC